MHVNSKLIHFYILLFICMTSQLNAIEANPRANPQSIIVFGKARFTILTPLLIRMEWNTKIQFEDRASLVFINRKLPTPEFTKTISGKRLIIKTKELSISFTDDGKSFNSENLLAQFVLNNKKVKWMPGLKDSLNLKGTLRTVDGKDSVTSAMLEDGIISRSGWAVIDDSRQLLFDGSTPNWVTTRIDTIGQDLYIFAYGHRYKEALNDYVKVAGPIPMPPKFAFGYWYSRYFCYSDADVKELVNEMDRFDIPIDVFIVDMDWHNTYGVSARKKNWDGWSGYTWNKNLFPNPDEFLNWMHNRQLKVSLNLHPASGIFHKEDCFYNFGKAIGKDTTGINHFEYNPEDKYWSKAYFEKAIRPLEKQGVDFWWLDWQQKEMTNIPGLNNTWWLNHNFFTDMELHRETRPLLFHRWGGMGNHRYQVGFSGDSFSTFKMLGCLPYFTATASNVGYGYWSHDIGGHMQKTATTNPELYLRWIQFGVFSPILRTHSSKQGNIERRIWKFSNFELMNDALHLRYALAPYIYTASREAYDTGISICRPMYYNYPEESEAYRSNQEYMFGDDLLVAPIAQAVDPQGVAEQTVWLPKGEWYEMSSGTLYKGNQTIKTDFTVAEIPWFAKAGSIIPMNPKVKNLQVDPRHIVFTVVPGKEGKGRLYEDEGNSKNYISGEYAFTEITQQRIDKLITIQISPRSGKYKGMSDSRAYTFKVLGVLPPEKVVVNGLILTYSREILENSWQYDAINTELVISIPLTNCQTAVNIQIETVTMNDLTVVDGMKGRFNRMKQVGFEMKSIISSKDWARSPSEDMLHLTQLPSIIENKPETALSEFIFYKENIEKVWYNMESEYQVSSQKVQMFKKYLHLK